MIDGIVGLPEWESRLELQLDEPESSQSRKVLEGWRNNSGCSFAYTFN